MLSKSRLLKLLKVNHHIYVTSCDMRSGSVCVDIGIVTVLVLVRNGMEETKLWQQAFPPSGESGYVVW